MSPTITLVLDLLIAGLLIATIVYAIILNKQLITLHESRGEMEALIRTFNEATARAETGIKGMRRTAVEIGESMQKTVERAIQLRDELTFLIEAGDALAQRLADPATQAARATAAAAAASPTRRQALQPTRRLPDLNDVSQDLPRGRGVLTRPDPPPRSEGARPDTTRLDALRAEAMRLDSQRSEGQRSEGQRSGPERSGAEPPEAGRALARRPVDLNDVSQDLPRGRGILAQDDSGRGDSTRRSGGRTDLVERPMPGDEAKPARREGSDGLSRAERELLEAMQARR